MSEDVHTREYNLHIDVLVIGAGPAGSVAAARLAAAGAKVALLDRRKMTKWKVGESLPPVSAHLLRAIGIDSAFDAARHLSATGVRVAWSGNLTEKSFLASPYGSGWLLIRPEFDQGLREFAIRSGVRFLSETRISGVRRRRNRFHCELHQNAGLTSCVADWVVDCSGRTATFAIRQGATRIVHDRLVAFWRVYRSSNGVRSDDDTTTTVESAEHGWYYTAQIPGSRRVVAFLTDGDLPACAVARTAAAWRQMLNHTQFIRALVDDRKYQPETPVQTDLACSTHLKRATGTHWVAAGDAAMAFDPLSSNGIASALSTGLNASSAILESHAGHDGALTNYADEVEEVYRHYLAGLRQRYAMGRGHTSEFWRRRNLAIS